MLCANRSEIVSALFSEGYGKDYMKKYSILSRLSISNASEETYDTERWLSEMQRPNENVGCRGSCLF
jgi:hypothetical protein